MNSEKLQALIAEGQRKYLIEINRQINRVIRQILKYMHNESAEDLESLRIFFHSMKGTAGTLELSNLSEEAKICEDLLLNVPSEGENKDIHFNKLYKSLAHIVVIIEDEMHEVTEKNSQNQVPVAEAAYTRNGLGKILILAEDLELLDELHDRLRNNGFEAYITQDLNVLKEALQDRQFDLVIIDMSLSNQSGINIQQEVDTRLFELPIIFLSKDGDETFEDMRLREGIDYVYQKTVDPMVIVSRVEELMKISMTFNDQMHLDDLTGALTRKAFLAHYKKKMIQLKKNNNPFSVAFVDLDRFKAINDQYGHLFGDKILMHFVKVIQTHLNNDSAIFRFGGDEFLLIFGETDAQTANKKIGEIREQLINEPLYSEEKQEHVVTYFSAGVTEIKSLSESSSDALKKADKALYVAKDQNRNNTIIHSEVVEEKAEKNRILVVDDEVFLANIIKTRLNYLGYKVTHAKDGFEALEQLDKQTFDLMLLDIMLPKINGIEVLKRTRSQEIHEDVKIIMLSAKQKSTAMLETLKLGADDFIEKPFSIEVLEQKIKKMLRN